MSNVGAVVKTLIGVVLLLCAVSLIIGDIIYGVKGQYEYDVNYASYWNIADKASTIPMKSEYVDKFVSSLEKSDLRGKYDAVWLTTPDNSFDYNLIALKSLQGRLHKIEKMDITSFQYQTAIQQITAQEQGKAHKMLGVFSGVWWKENHFWLWDWAFGINILAIFVGLIVGVMFFAAGSAELNY